MDDSPELRWSLDLRSFLLGCLAPSALATLLIAWAVSPWWFSWLFLGEGHSVAHSDLNAIGYAVGNFAKKHSGELPQSLEELVTPDERGHTYLKSLPVDPWGRPYVYEPRASGSAWLRCWGEDGRARTSDDVVLVVDRAATCTVREATHADLSRSPR